ncbi:MAG: cyclic nucleotide-binding domain-containing protein [Gammaproteobacteria bacterium]
MTTLKQDLKVLRKVPLFGGLDRAKLELMAFTSESLQFEDGEVLFGAGAESDSVYVILDGTADVLVNTPSGPVLTDRVSPNELVGEMDVLRDAHYSTTARARGELTALRISRDHFLQFLSETPKEALEVMRQLSNKLARYHDNVAAGSSSP